MTLYDFELEFSYDCPDQSRELAFYPQSCLKNFVVSERLVQNSRSHVRHAADAKSPQSAVSGGNDFGNSGHAYCIRTQDACGPDFGRSLEIRT